MFATSVFQNFAIKTKTQTSLNPSYSDIFHFLCVQNQSSKLRRHVEGNEILYVVFLLFDFSNETW